MDRETAVSLWHKTTLGGPITGRAVELFATAVEAAERERWQRIRVLADQCAEWHVGDGDECGEIARKLLSLLRA